MHSSNPSPTTYFRMKYWRANAIVYPMLVARNTKSIASLLGSPPLNTYFIQGFPRNEGLNLQKQRQSSHEWQKILFLVPAFLWILLQWHPGCLMPLLRQNYEQSKHNEFLFQDAEKRDWYEPDHSQHKRYHQATWHCHKNRHLAPSRELWKVQHNQQLLAATDVIRDLYRSGSMTPLASPPSSQWYNGSSRYK